MIINKVSTKFNFFQYFCILMINWWLKYNIIWILQQKRHLNQFLNVSFPLSVMILANFIYSSKFYCTILELCFGNNLRHWVFNLIQDENQLSTALYHLGYTGSLVFEFHHRLPLFTEPPSLFVPSNVLSLPRCQDWRMCRKLWGKNCL